LKLEVGALLTVVALVSMIYWSVHELRRVDKIIEQSDGRKEGNQEDNR